MYFNAKKHFKTLHFFFGLFLNLLEPCHQEHLDLPETCHQEYLDLPETCHQEHLDLLGPCHQEHLDLLGPCHQEHLDLLERWHQEHLDLLGLPRLVPGSSGPEYICILYNPETTPELWGLAEEPGAPKTLGFTVGGKWMVDARRNSQFQPDRPQRRTCDFTWGLCDFSLSLRSTLHT